MTAFSRVSVLAWQLVGVLLFLFIPLVLVLFVRHPEPLWASLVGGIALMLGHRFAARPYMLRMLPAKCIWCNRWLPEDTASETVPLESGSSELQLRTCSAHALPTRRFFGFLRRARFLLRLGIFLPLLLLLAALAAAAWGDWDQGLAPTTALFQLAVGLTVNVAALGYLTAAADPAPRATFPVHNFYLLGVRWILWIFRLMGIWWIWVGARSLLAGR